MAITRDDYERACRDFVDKHRGSDDNVLGGWSWNEHPNYSHLGYLSRKITVYSAQNTSEGGTDTELGDVFEEDDAAAAVTRREQNDILEAWQYIVYSASFQVPAFYFSVNTRSGTRLGLDGILGCSLFRRNAFADVKKTSFALQAAGQNFPLLSQGEHPTLCTPCWFLHPCETGVALGELMEADGQITKPSARMLELWLLLVGNVVDVRESASA
ncbi:hypothetical protein M0805_005357 [Coniferiporia weirii]|nr:hypothetical protein M0805_005357 [Coniferiporia weirii]